MIDRAIAKLDQPELAYKAYMSKTSHGDGEASSRSCSSRSCRGSQGLWTTLACQRNAVSVSTSLPTAEKRTVRAGFLGSGTRDR